MELSSGSSVGHNIDVHYHGKKMGTDREEWISKRAYELWEEAGRPDGHDEEQWHLPVQNGRLNSDPLTHRFKTASLRTILMNS